MKNYAQQMQHWRERREKITALQAQGMSLADIARKLRITPQRVGQIAKNGKARA